MEPPPQIQITPAALETVSEKVSRKVSIADDDDKNTHAEVSKLHSILKERTSSEDGKKENGNAMSKIFDPDTLQIRVRYSGSLEKESKTWWYRFCVKCRGEDEENIPSWEPNSWPRFCPYPFFPTYRQFSRVACLILIGLLFWCVIYSIVGDTAAPPHGKLFQLILISICAYLGGWVVSLTTLPALIGMLFTGLFLQNAGVVDLDESFSEVANKIRHGALVIILIRAGLDLDPKALWKWKWVVVRLSLIPWLTEGGVCAISAKFLFGMTWSYSILLGSIIAAVAPAVVVPCLFRLRTKGYGVAKGIPTLIIAVASIDDATSIAVFGIIKSIMFVHSSLTSLVLQGPVSIIGGFGFGILFGLLLKYAPERHDKFVVPFRILMLLAAGMAAIYFSEHLGYGGAGPLGAVVAAFVSLIFWTKQGWSIEENPASTAFQIFWMIVEPVLFGITGAQVRFEELHGTVVLIGIGILIMGIIIRILVTMVTGIGCNLNAREKIFCAIAWMPKATVQAALAPIVLSLVSDPNSKEHSYAKKILTVCILSIMITTTIGATLVTLLGSKLLRKTKFAVEPEQWRRSHRPSVRDISIVDDDETEDSDQSEESPKDKDSESVNENIEDINNDKDSDVKVDIRRRISADDEVNHLDLAKDETLTGSDKVNEDDNKLNVKNENLLRVNEDVKDRETKTDVKVSDKDE
ncbi:sodium/hydrogen exchanger 9B2-like [Sitophilus oryzae]|uniref:Sodium/hydrogen exchanger 9B2-like n=1 Tax=Sitophilus oryzae TaxID=7048 RepID=A0A6J2XLL2_SITOR|nr:sodium/hydrogen exchanger 9B2-like [Sitophilus oryzae]